jgi:hypothetical protein
LVLAMTTLKRKVVKNLKVNFFGLKVWRKKERKIEDTINREPSKKEEERE